MRVFPTVGRVLRRLRSMLGRTQTPRYGDTEVADARRLADAERTLDRVPDDCSWLDAQTVDDLDLPHVFRAIDRTSTPTGAQALWRWLAAPATTRRMLDDRERKLTALAEPTLRDRITHNLPQIAGVDAHFLPRLLWEPATSPSRSPVALFLVVGLVTCLLLAAWSPTFVVGAALFVVAAMIFDTIAQRDLAEQAYALVVLSTTLDGAARLAYQSDLPAELRGTIREDLVVRSALRRRLQLLSANDPFGLLEAVRSLFLVRLFAIRSSMRIVGAEVERLRRIVLWVGELDALASVARLRTERDDVRVPELVDATRIDAHALVHPVLENAVGNDLSLDAGLLVTGSNMSGKSTFLRTIGVNAILAQSIHTTFGAWQAPLLRVRAAMRINDDLGRGMSTYAAEVASIGELVKGATDAGSLRMLAVIDEPFHGTNPAVRVPIVVAVLEHLAAQGFVVAATHDLDVARLVGDAFVRGYFTELPSGDFDRTLKPGIAPSTNACALLERAGYPPELLERIRRPMDDNSASRST